MIMVLLAGRGAHRKHDNPTARFDRALADYSEAADPMMNIAAGDNEEGDPLVKWIQRRVVTYVGFLWTPIWKAASVILDGKELGGREAAKFIKQLLREGVA